MISGCDAGSSLNRSHAALCNAGNGQVETRLDLLDLYLLAVLQYRSQPATVETGAQFVLHRFDRQQQAAYFCLLVGPQNLSAQKINELGFIWITGNGARAYLKLLGPSGTL